MSKDNKGILLADNIDNGSNLITNQNTSELKPNKTEEPLHIIEALQNNEIVKSNNGLENYVASQLINIIETAVMPDHQGNLVVDYHAKIQGLKQILRISNNIKDNQTNINIGLFNSPTNIDH